MNNHEQKKIEFESEPQSLGLILGEVNNALIRHQNSANPEAQESDISDISKMSEIKPTERQPDLERRGKLVRFHDTHVEELRERVERLGGPSAVNNLLLRSSGYVNNMLSPRAEGSFVHPEILYALRYLEMKKAETGSVPNPDAWPVDLRQELKEVTEELAQLKNQLKTLVDK